MIVGYHIYQNVQDTVVSQELHMYIVRQPGAWPSWVREALVFWICKNHEISNLQKILAMWYIHIYFGTFVNLASEPVSDMS